MYESKRRPLISNDTFVRRFLRNFIWSAAIIFFSLLVGTFGYHFSAGLDYLDSFYNSCMILTGMGPVSKIDCVSGKLFASFYALFSGLAFLTTMAVFLAPIVHRFMHYFHMEDKSY